MLEQLEAPLHPEQKKQVIEAVKKLGLKVVPAEVAAEANLPLAVTTLQLNCVAAETNAGLEVSQDGNLTYVFDPRFEQSYAVSATRNVFKWSGRVLANTVMTLAKVLFLASFFVLRMSIGILLVLSVLLILVVAVVALLRLFEGVSGDSGGGGGGDLDLSGMDVFSGGDEFISRPGWLYWSFDWLWDWIYYGDYLWGRPYYYSSYSSLPDYLGDFHYADGSNKRTEYGAGTIREEQRKPKKKSRFLDNCYTLLFGAGDPNMAIDQKRWREIAAVLRANLGAVTAEQVAPYLETNDRNQDWMIPVLVRFNGIPEVSEQGTIIYTFPAFQQQASNNELTQTGLNQPAVPVEEPNSDAEQLRALVRGHITREKALKQAKASQETVETYLAEERWTLGLEPDSYWPIFCFAGFAVAGSLSLLNVSAHLPYAQILQPILIGILIYGGLFFLIPACRWCFNEQRNRGIDERNERRSSAAALVRSPSPELQRKFDEARAAAIHSLAQSNAAVVYTTQKDELEQRFN